MNVLYKDLESLDVLEQLDDKSYDFIYLDIPYGKYPSDYYMHEFKKLGYRGSFANYICETLGAPLEDLPEGAFDKEHAKWEQLGYKRYAESVSKIVENTHRLLKDNGVLAFLAPMEDYTKINYKLLLDQFFPLITNVTIKIPYPRRIKTRSINTDKLLYFCTKKKDFEFPILKELPPKDLYKQQDAHGEYRLEPALFRHYGRVRLYQYEWHGISVPEGQCWVWKKEEMDELFADNRIVIKDNDVFIKCYRNEESVPMSTTWEYNDNTTLAHVYGGSIDSQSIERMFEMFVTSKSNILCPFDRDGKFSMMADQAGYTWTSICPPEFPDKCELFSNIPEDHYTVITELEPHEDRSYNGGIITGVNDLTEVKEMMSKINEIQDLVGADSPEEAINEIQDLIDTSVSDSSISASVPEAQEWVKPYWDKLDPESQLFLPTGVALYHQFLEDPDADMAAPMLEYCKALEREVFTKLFCGYVIELRDNDVNIGDTYSDAFENDEIRPFAEFLQRCLGRRNRQHPDRWMIEMGTMAHILSDTLKDTPSEPIYADFRAYLDNAFESGCFGANFCDELTYIASLRDKCAHPHMVNADMVTTEKDKIRENLLLILEYYKDDEE